MTALIDHASRRRFLAALDLAQRPATDGERLAAEHALGRMVASNADVFRSLLQERPPWRQPMPRPADWRDLCERCLRRSEALTPWERGFLTGLLQFRKLSHRQHEALLEIATKVASKGRRAA